MVIRAEDVGWTAARMRCQGVEVTIEPDASTPSATATTTIRVASVPAAHPYVTRVCASAAVVLLPDAPLAGAPAGVWWPPAILDPAWIAAHRSHADLLHIHFGTESFPPGHLTACVDAAHAAGWPIVFTVHDLDHPQLEDQAAYHRQLDELIPAVDAVITLTPGAAGTISRRWGREATVIPHPALLRTGTPIPDATPSGALRIGVFLNDLRPNVDGPAATRTLSAAIALLHAQGIGAVGEVRMRRRVRDDRARDLIRALCAAAPRLSLVEHDRLPDAELAGTLNALDASVLPYRHGTHSGWLELCWDLGVPVAAPDVGHYTQQHSDGVRAFIPEDPRSLADALVGLTRSAPRAGTRERGALIASRARSRARTDAAATDAHLALYRRLLAERAA